MAAACSFSALARLALKASSSGFSGLAFFSAAAFEVETVVVDGVDRSAMAVVILCSQLRKKLVYEIEGSGEFIF